MLYSLPLLSWPAVQYIVIVLTAWTVYHIATHIRLQFTDLPPGPIGFPVLGHLPFLRRKPYKRIDRYKQKYGPIFSLYLGPHYAVVLAGIEAVKEAFNQEAFIHRPKNFSLNVRKDVQGLVVSSGDVWKEQRNFTLRILRNFGFGKSLMEDMIKNEVGELIKRIRHHRGLPLDPDAYLCSSISNIICQMVLGRRFDLDDPQRLWLDRVVEHTLIINQLSPHAYFPWAMKLFVRLKLFKYHIMHHDFTLMLNFVKDEIDIHRKTLDPNNPRDYIDCYLMEMDEHSGESEVTSFTENMLKGNIRNLFGAGSETVWNQMRWCLLLMAIHQDVQERVQKELEAIVGNHRELSLSDHINMPYLQCTINECMRWSSSFHFNPLRSPPKDITIQGYRIPKGTLVMASLWSVHHDPNVWKEPNRFLPERFLEPDGSKVIKHEAFIPYSFGRRTCPGEMMASAELFLFFGSILHHFTLSLAEPRKFPSLDGEGGITIGPQSYELCFSERS